MGLSRALGGLLCFVCAVIAAIWFLYPLARITGIDFWFIKSTWVAPWFLVIPVVIGVLVLAGLGFWLGWIMASTKEISPPTPAPAPKPKRIRRK